MGRWRDNFKPVLTSCAESYARSSLLKGGARGDHFLDLSAIAARCGFRDNAEEWLREGVKGTLSYGYRKDDTLMRLADVLHRVNRHRPEKAFLRSAAVLEMIKWMHHVSDGAITQEFPQEFFPVVLDADRPAALDLLRFYYKRFGRWQANACAKTYILSSSGSDPEYLWALSSVLHPNESLKCRQHIAGLPAVLSSSTGSSVPLSSAWRLHRHFNESGALAGGHEGTGLPTGNASVGQRTRRLARRPEADLSGWRCGNRGPSDWTL